MRGAISVSMNWVPDLLAISIPYSYSASAAEVNTLKPVDSRKLRRVPQPPKQYRKIMVDRPNRDMIGPDKSVWIVDTRMRANTDGQLADWRFLGNEAAGSDMLAAPAVYTRVSTDDQSTQFKIAFVGTPQSFQGPDSWSSVMDGETYELKQSDYLGLMLLDAGRERGEALVPYTTDDWTKLS